MKWNLELISYFKLLLTSLSGQNGKVFLLIQTKNLNFYSILDIITEMTSEICCRDEKYVVCVSLFV